MFLADSWRWLRIQLLRLSWAGYSSRRNISFKSPWKWFCASLGWTIKWRSLAERKLLEAHKSEVLNLGKGCRASATAGEITWRQPRLIGNTCLYIHFCNTVIMYLAARFAAVSKWNVQRVALKHTFNTWPWHVFITLVQTRIAVFLLCCLRYVLRPFIIQISGECR